jgi:hypothetical protein
VFRGFCVSWGSDDERVLLMRDGITKVRREIMRSGAHYLLLQRYIYRLLEGEGFK